MSDRQGGRGVLLGLVVGLVCSACSGEQTVSPTPEPTEDVSAFTLLEDAVASVDGFGFLTIGTEVAMIEEQFGIRVAFECGGSLIAPDGPDNVEVVTLNPTTLRERLARVTISAIPNVGGQATERTLTEVRTDAGVVLGGPASAVDEAYDEPLVELEVEHPDNPIDRVLMFVGPDEKELLYSITDGVVSHIVIRDGGLEVPPCE